MEQSFNTQAIRDEARCQGAVKEVNFRETDTQFVYRGSRGIVITDKGEDRAGAYVHFVKALRTQFKPRNVYHQVGSSRFDVPVLDVEMAKAFLDIVDTAEAQLAAVA